MAKYPGLMIRGTTFYLRAKVPADLRQSIGRREIWKSLETGDRRQAIARYHTAKGEVEQQFGAARRRAEGLSESEIRLAVAEWLGAYDARSANADFAALAAGRQEEALEAAREDLNRTLSLPEDTEGHVQAIAGQPH